MSWFFAKGATVRHPFAPGVIEHAARSLFGTRLQRRALVRRLRIAGLWVFFFGLCGLVAAFFVYLGVMTGAIGALR